MKVAEYMGYYTTILHGSATREYSNYMECIAMQKKKTEEEERTNMGKHPERERQIFDKKVRLDHDRLPSHLKQY